jgi:hypothetical protein
MLVSACFWLTLGVCATCIARCCYVRYDLHPCDFLSPNSGLCGVTWTLSCKVGVDGSTMGMERLWDRDVRYRQGFRFGLGGLGDGELLGSFAGC